MHSTTRIRERTSKTDHVLPSEASNQYAPQVALENCAVLVTSRVQALEVTAGKETNIVEEGKSYRVSIGGACNNRSNLPPVVQGRFLAAPIAIGVVTIIGVRKGLESPDRP